MNLDAELVTRAFNRVGAKCREDAQFAQSTKFWDGALRLGIGHTVLIFRFDAGELQSVHEGDDDGCASSFQRRPVIVWVELECEPVEPA